jgi:uncharacterized protein YecE (DUF72 family)
MLLIGTSGWQYRDWRGALYPAGLPTTKWLGHYAQGFSTVEVNSSFYRLPAEGVFGRWAAATPESFRFAVKASRYLTHQRRLRDPEEPVALLLERARELGPKLAVVLVQLPPTMRADAGRLDATLAAFQREVRLAVEFRDESWHDERIYRVLTDHDAALCWWDRRGAQGPFVRTATWCYVRLHEGRASPAPCYGRTALETWSRRLVESYGSDVDGYVYFNNDARACAPKNARDLVRLADRLGLAAERPAAVCA